VGQRQSGISFACEARTANYTRSANGRIQGSAVHTNFIFSFESGGCYGTYVNLCLFFSFFFFPFSFFFFFFSCCTVARVRLAQNVSVAVVIINAKNSPSCFFPSSFFFFFVCSLMFSSDSFLLFLFCCSSHRIGSGHKEESCG
jgi:hypothetical protein